MIDSKGTGAGTLTLDARGRGVLVRPDGTTRPEPWLDSRKTYSAAGVMYRLTGLPGCPVWVVPSATELDPEVAKAHALRNGGTVTTIDKIYEGILDGLYPAPQVPPLPSVAFALMRHLSDPPAEAWL